MNYENCTNKACSGNSPEDSPHFLLLFPFHCSISARKAFTDQISPYSAVNLQSLENSLWANALGSAFFIWLSIAGLFYILQNNSVTGEVDMLWPSETAYPRNLWLNSKDKERLQKILHPRNILFLSSKQKSLLNMFGNIAKGYPLLLKEYENLCQRIRLVHMCCFGISG